MTPLIISGTGSGLNNDNSILRVYRSESTEKYKDCKDRLDYLFDRDAILQQGIQDPINDSLSEWRKTEKLLNEIEQELDYQRIFMQAGILARKNGTSLIVPILSAADDTKIALNRTLETAITDGAKIKRLMVVEKFEETENSIADTFSDYHGRPVYYKLGDKKNKLHHTRAIPVYGNLNKTSIFLGVEEYLSAFQLARQDVSRAIQEANFLILKTNFEELQKIVDNRNVVGNENTDLYEFIQNRLIELRCNANNNNAYAIDKDNEEIDNIQKANIDDMVKALDQMAQFVAGAFNIPMSKLFAKNQTGLSGTSRADIENYIQFLKGMRFMVLHPCIVELDRFVKKFNKTLDISFEWNPISIERYLDINKEDKPNAD